MNVYRRKIPASADGTSDIYDVAAAYGVDCPARFHALKKLLLPGQRGAKGVVQDLEEAGTAIRRAIELAQPRLTPEQARDVLACIEEYEGGGWITHDGSKWPPVSQCRVKAELRYGRIFTRDSCLFDWSKVKRFRVIKEDKDAEYPTN